jgi:hypothetical protein
MRWQITDKIIIKKDFESIPLLRGGNRRLMRWRVFFVVYA